MTPEEKQLVSGLFDRLRQADTQPKDPEAEALIRQAVSAQPSSPYLLVQTMLVQEHALTNAQARIAALEKQVQETQAAGSTGKSAGFLGSLFGSGSQPAQPQLQAAPPPANYAPRPAVQQPAYAPPPEAYAPTQYMAPSSGSGFLGSAVRTAAGVAGGALLFEGISGLLNHNAGPFSGGLGGGLGGGLFGGGQAAPTEVVNNYYEAPSDAGGGGSGGGYDQGGGDPGWNQGNDPGYDPAATTDPGYDQDDSTQV